VSDTPDGVENWHTPAAPEGRSRTTLLVAVAAAIVVLLVLLIVTALGVTGFVIAVRGSGRAPFGAQSDRPPAAHELEARVATLEARLAASEATPVEPTPHASPGAGTRTSGVESTPPTARSLDRPFLGIEVAPAPGADGVAVGTVIPASGAAVAGLQSGDLILAAAGSRVVSPTALAEVIAGFEVGDTIELEVTRDGERLTFQVTLGPRPIGPGN
jgi:predicted metalloprotease with PDZ domain